MSPTWNTDNIHDGLLWIRLSVVLQATAAHHWHFHSIICFSQAFFFLFLSCTIIKPPVCSESLCPPPARVHSHLCLPELCVCVTQWEQKVHTSLPPNDSLYSSACESSPLFRPSQNRPSHWFTFHFFLWCYFWVPAWYAWTRGRAPWISRLQRRREKGDPAFKICAIIIPHLHLRM